MGYIGCDLDETLCEYEDGMAGDYKIGKPIPEMMDRIREHLADGFEVRIFTARVNKIDGWDHEGQRQLISDWTLEHFGQRLQVSNEKTFGMIFFYDDRAVGVKNGKLLNRPPGFIGVDFLPAGWQNAGMSIFFLLLVPLLIAAIGFFAGKGKIDPRELAIQVVAVLIAVLVPYAIALSGKTSDAEI